MADNLRDRIARAAQRHAESSSRLGENTEPAVSKTGSVRDRIAEVLCEDGQRPMHTAMRLADAVIAELGLRPEWGIKEEKEPEPGWLGETREELVGKVRPGEKLMRRLITDWRADDE